MPVAIVIPADYPILAPQPYVEPTDDMELVRTSHQSPYQVHPEAGSRRGRVDTVTAWTPDHSSLIDVVLDLCRLFSEVPPVKARRAAPVPQPPQPVAASPYAVVDRPGGAPAAATTGNPAYPAFPSRPPQPPAPGLYPPIQPSNGAAGHSWYPQPAAQPPHNPYTSNSVPPPPQPSGHTQGYPGMPGFGQPPAPPAAPPPKPTPVLMSKEVYSEAFKRKAVDALVKRVITSLELSCASAGVELAQLESKVEKLAKNREACALSVLHLSRIFRCGRRDKSQRRCDCVQALLAAKKARTGQLQAVEENTTRLCTARQRLGQWLSENEDKGRHLRDDLTPEDVIVASDELSAQAIKAQVCTEAVSQSSADTEMLVCHRSPKTLRVARLQAEDMAIEECFDVLSSALNNGAIELDVYIKSLRLLAEDQYRCRLLGMKIQEKQRSQQQPLRSAETVQLPQGDNWRNTSTYPALS